jgi:curved DNA-binding protein
MAVKYQDYYQTLGVSRDASQDEIHQAYRKLARKYHPDVNKSEDAEQKFKEISEAYEVLKDPEKRKKYDSLGQNWNSGDDFTPPPGWEEFVGGGGRSGFGFGQGGGFGNFDFDIFGDRGSGGGGGFSDFFESLFGGLGGFGGGATEEDFGARGWAQKGQDHEADVTISLEDAYFGGKKTVTLQQQETDARGQIHSRTRNYEVNIPSGTTDGKRLRLSGQGGHGPGVGQKGDLYLRLHIARHPQFRVNGPHLETDVRITPWEAALGTKVDVPIVGGKAAINIPAGTQSGKKLRLKGKGLKKRDGGSGDLFAVVQIAVPQKLSDKERELFEELARTSNFNPRER